MKALRILFLWLTVSCGLAANSASAADTAQSVPPAEERALIVAYEVALINKSMTGDWEDEREFRKQVKQVFGKSEVLKFKLRGEPLQDWLDKESPPTVKILCLIDGWVGPTMTRVDVRGSWDGKPLKQTFKVKDRNWKGALAQAKQYAEATR
jgi:hypothetical protein